MPNQQLPPGFDGAHLDFSDAPGGDVSFDELFPPEGNQPQPQAAPSQPEPQATPTQPEEDFFLKAGQSVYKTAEDAKHGIEHKDNLIARYRSYLAQQGVDPDNLTSTRQPEPQPEPQAQSSPYKYLNNSKRLFEDLAKAASKGDADSYARTLGEYLDERMNAQYEPVKPLLAEVARQRAVRQLSGEVQGFDQFLGSNDYRETLDKLPVLKDAITRAEADINAAPVLDQMYRIVYLVNRGLKPAQPQAAPQPTQPTPAARPTTAPSTMTPPAPSVDTRNWATSTEARKQLIRDAEGKGIGDIRFEDFKL